MDKQDANEGDKLGDKTTNEENIVIEDYSMILDNGSHARFLKIMQDYLKYIIFLRDNK